MRPLAVHPLSDPYARSAVVIDPCPDHRSRLAASLSQQGFTVYEAHDGFRGLDMTSRYRPDLTIIEADLPGIDGYETVRRIRQFLDGFIVMMAADSSESAVVEGFRAGADDFIAKPYGAHALRARLDAMMRRSRTFVAAGVGAPAAETAAWLEHGSLRLHLGSRRLEVLGVECELTRSEFDLLATFMRAKEQVFSKASLALMLREANGLPGQHITSHDRHAVEVHIMNLRRKLDDDPRAPQCIETVRGFGYRLAPLTARQPVALHAAAG
jgi:DNA-binding response OmpR family regulator